MNDLLAALKRIGRPRMLVLGDVMLDRYTWGNTDRSSPEAPVLVLEAESQDARPGGAANVAMMLAGLDADVTLAGVVGQDHDAYTLKRLLDEARVQHRLVESVDRPTTLKERFMGRAAGRHPHQILRVDRESKQILPPETAEELAETVIEGLTDTDALLISDYGKGVLPDWLPRIIQAAKALQLPVIVDPSCHADYERYRGASVITPNRRETETAAATPIHGVAEAMDAGQWFCCQFGLDAVLVTLDQEGAVLVRPDEQGKVFPTRARHVYDITGAGDMVLAMLGMALAAGVDLEHAIRLANAAAGLEVERLGVSQVSRSEIEADVCGSTVAVKQLTEDELQQRIGSDRRQGHKIVFTNGCFDLLHVGHIRCLEEAASLGDKLVVAINSDESVSRLKGPGRPLIEQYMRATVLAALACVDYVVIFDEPTPVNLLRRLRPDVLVKGGTYSMNEVVGREIVEDYGGKVYLAKPISGVSTTSILELLHARGDGSVVQSKAG